MLLKWITRHWQATDSAATLLESAQAMRSEGRLDAARDACLELLRDQPGEARAMALLAAIAADQHQFDNGLRWVQRALAADGACVPAHFAKGRLLEGMERFQEAEASYRQVVRLDPRHAKGYTNLGCMLHIQGRIDEAIACYRKALEFEPGQPEALRNFALVAGTTSEQTEALAGFERYLVSHPRDAQAQYQLAHLYLQRGRPQDAMAGYDRAIALDPEQPEFHFARAQLLLSLGRYAEGWREYEWRWRIQRFNGSMTRFAQPRWDGGRLDGTLLLHSEPGFGDVFQLIRYASLAAQRCKRVVVECKPALMELVAGVPGVAQVVREGDPLPPFDAHLPPIAFPHAFGTTIDTIPWPGPYIAADAQRLQAWSQRVEAAGPRARKVGVVWTGDPTNLSNRERSVTLEQLAPLARVPGVSFFSLQKGGESARPGRIPEGMHFVDLTGEIRDFSDTAALVAQLDLVVSIDTSVAHLAGAMDRPTWMLLPFSADWRFHMGRDDNPWYPRMRLFRQREAGDWSEPVRAMAQALEHWVGAAK